MRLVPRQLQIHGLTGDVPYFGGRFTPAQAYAAARPRPAPPGAMPPGGMAPVGGPRGVMPAGSVPAGGPGELGPIPGVPAAVPGAAPLRVPSNLQPTQSPSVLAAAAAQPAADRPGQVPGGLLGTQVPPTGAPMPPPPPGTGGPVRPESQRAIQQLLLAGVLTSAEADQLAARLT